MRPTLYHLESCPRCEKVRLALSLEGLSYESVLVDPANREPVRQISGQQELPVLVEQDGTVTFEATRILRRLAARPGSTLLPEGRRDQALTRILVDRADGILEPLVHRVVHGKDPDGRSLRDDDLLVIERRLAEELAVLEGMLERGPYLLGGRPTVADICVHAYLSQLTRVAGRSLPESCLRVRSWYDRLEKAAATARA